MGSLTSSSIRTKQKPTMNPLSTIFFKVLGNPSKKNTINDADVKKINQKLFLGNERTFLKWMYVSVWTTGAAIGLSAVAPSSSSTAVATNSVYGSNFQAYSSLLFTGISIIICTYAMVQCKFIQFWRMITTFRISPYISFIINFVRLVPPKKITQWCMRRKVPLLLLVACFASTHPLLRLDFIIAYIVILLCFELIIWYKKCISYQNTVAKRTLLIVKRSPSGYEDRYGPVIIGAMFVLAFTAQYCIMMAQFTR